MSDTLIDCQEILVSKCTSYTMAGKIYVSCRTEQSFETKLFLAVEGAHTALTSPLSPPAFSQATPSRHLTFTEGLLSAWHCSKMLYVLFH